MEPVGTEEVESPPPASPASASDALAPSAELAEPAKPAVVAGHRVTHGRAGEDSPCFAHRRARFDPASSPGAREDRPAEDTSRIQFSNSSAPRHSASP